MEISYPENGMCIEVHPKVYSLELLHKCFYWYGDDYDIEINSIQEKNLILIRSKNQNDSTNYEGILARIKRDLIDFKTREIITEETKNIRDLLVAKAFAHEDDFVQEPPGIISDPVGYHP